LYVCTCTKQYLGDQVKENEAWHVARMSEMRNAYKIVVGKPETKNHSEDLSINGR